LYFIFILPVGYLTGCRSNSRPQFRMKNGGCDVVLASFLVQNGHDARGARWFSRTSYWVLCISAHLFIDRCGCGGKSSASGMSASLPGCLRMPH